MFDSERNKHIKKFCNETHRHSKQTEKKQLAERIET